jgi:hypothetical protein
VTPRETVAFPTCWPEVVGHPRTVFQMRELVASNLRGEHMGSINPFPVTSILVSALILRAPTCATQNSFNVVDFDGDPTGTSDSTLP